MDGAVLRGRLANRAHVLDRVHARELLVGGERRVKSRQVLADAGSDQLVLDRGEARRPLGMARAHLVLEAIWMRYECRRHPGILAYEYNRRMLLKAEFQPRSV